MAFFMVSRGRGMHPMRNDYDFLFRDYGVHALEVVERCAGRNDDAARLPHGAPKDQSLEHSIPTGVQVRMRYEREIMDGSD